ncbi:MAG TPA: glucans biosynthesis glucosyltransferase MdoH, partial [Bauldia sp.]|nr:glucans biosynthesis glucosyltransferase MdoH [Bauldia sp.]
MDGGLTGGERRDSGAAGAAAEPRVLGMPPASPLAMPEQDLRHFSPRPGDLVPRSRRFVCRRVAVLGGAALVSAVAIAQMASALDVGGLTAIEVALLVVFSVNFAWIALTFTTAFAGLVVRLRRRRMTKRHAGELRCRVAVAIPTYNETPDRVFAAVEAMSRGVAAAGPGRAFDWFVLSDTTDGDVALQEQAAFREARRRLAGIAAVYYRRRLRNVARKPGNIADFCRRWGGAYDHLIVLDADSLMEPETMIELVRRIEADPTIGLIQTVPRLVSGRTLFARLQQFAGRVYGQVIATGFAWWTGTEGNFWGHNAVIRIRAFTESAGLPVLRGRPPFGGHILSHDFVEAALMRRRGWGIVVADDLEGSCEEGPSTIAGLAGRDRRWCQGNLQHMRLLGAAGLRPVSGFHLPTGIMSYLASPLWLALIATGLALGIQAHFTRPDYFPDDFHLFPNWPVMDAAGALDLFGFTLAVLFGVK